MVDTDHGLTKSPWGLGTMDLEGREIWSIGIAQAVGEAFLLRIHRGRVT